MKLLSALKNTSELQKDFIVGSSLGIGISGGMAAGIQNPSNLAGDIVSSTGQELIEYGVKKAFAKQAAGIIAQQATSGAVKQAAAQVGKQLASTGIRSTITTAAKTAGAAASRTAMAIGGGPIGLALLIISISLGFIDMFWNPWKTYLNEDLQTMIDQLNNSAAIQFNLQGSRYPMVIKPNIQPETEEDIKQFQTQLIQYLRDRNLVFPVEAYAQVLKRIDDYNQYRMRKIEITGAQLNLLQDATTQAQQQDQISNWQQLKDITQATQLKTQLSDKMAQYIFISMTQEDTQTNRTQLLLYTALLYKKGIILPPSQRSFFTDIKQYIEVYWLRLFVYLSSLIVIILTFTLTF